MRVLVLGGTRFLGRAIVDAAVAAGHEVTLFNRGLSGPDLFPQLETVAGDRTLDLSALAGRTFDAVVDVAGYHPDVVGKAARELADATARYCFVSTVSVYADQSKPCDETAQRLSLSEHTGP